MTEESKIEIRALIRQLETYRVDQPQKLELAQALMLGAAVGLQQQYNKIGYLNDKIKKLQKVCDEMRARVNGLGDK